jgi:hypothetical protein
MKVVLHIFGIVFSVVAVRLRTVAYADCQLQSL